MTGLNLDSLALILLVCAQQSSFEGCTKVEWIQYFHKFNNLKKNKKVKTLPQFIWKCSRGYTTDLMKHPHLPPMTFDTV